MVSLGAAREDSTFSRLEQGARATKAMYHCSPPVSLGRPGCLELTTCQVVGGVCRRPVSRDTGLEAPRAETCLVSGSDPRACVHCCCLGQALPQAESRLRAAEDPVRPGHVGPAEPAEAAHQRLEEVRGGGQGDRLLSVSGTASWHLVGLQQAGWGLWVSVFLRYKLRCELFIPASDSRRSTTGRKGIENEAGSQTDGWARGSLSRALLQLLL